MSVGETDHGTPGLEPSELIVAIDRQSATDAAVRELRSLILTGRLPAGSALRQAELSKKLGLSRTPFREALQRLKAEGLVRLDPHKGAVVSRPTLAEVKEVYDLQILLEMEAARSAALARTPAGIEEVRQALEAHEESAVGVQWLESNIAFHTAIYRLAERPLLMELIGLLRNRGSVYVNILLRSDTGRARADEEHRLMFEALQDGDAERLADLVRDHLMATLGWLQTVISD